MKIIFLDVDGVLNHAPKEGERFEELDQKHIKIFQRIIKETDCKIVLSSSWRMHEDLVEKINDQVCEIIGKTISLASGFRGGEVAAWVNSNISIIDKYAILDDDSDFYPKQPLFKTEWSTGLTDEIADKVITYLNEDLEYGSKQ